MKPDQIVPFSIDGATTMQTHRVHVEGAQTMSLAVSRLCGCVNNSKDPSDVVVVVFGVTYCAQYEPLGP